MIKEVTINETTSVPVSELEFKFSRSGGKGGQNVNKVETKVELRFDVKNSTGLTDEQKALISERLANRMDSGGFLSVVVQDTRSQSQNKELSIERFADILKKVLKKKKKRIKIKVSKAAKEKRLEQKKRRSEVKKMRRIQ